MSEAKHTPGPWQIEGRYNGDLGSMYLSTMHPMPIFELQPIVGHRDEHFANARLIAAAPELLRNERKNLQTLEWQRFRMQELGYPTNELDLAIRQTEEVIAKAEGRSP